MSRTSFSRRVTRASIKGSWGPPPPASTEGLDRSSAASFFNARIGATLLLIRPPVRQRLNSTPQMPHRLVQLRRDRRRTVPPQTLSWPVEVDGQPIQRPFDLPDRPDEVQNRRVRPYQVEIGRAHV